MDKTISTLRTEVKRNIQQSSNSNINSQVDDALNNAYEKAWHAISWEELVRWDYTFESVVDQEDYNLPSDFGEELFLANKATGYKLVRMTNKEWWDEESKRYYNDALTSGTPSKYVIKKGLKKPWQVALYAPPIKAETYAMPYKKAFRQLLTVTGTCTSDSTNKIVASGSTFITDGVEAGMLVKNTTDNTYGYIESVDSETQLTLTTDLCPTGAETFAISNQPMLSTIDRYLVLKATAIMWRYYRKYDKSNYYESLAEIELTEQLEKEASPQNQHKFFRPQQRSRGYKIYDTGEPYDSV